MKVKVISCEIFRWICEENKYPNYDYVFYEIAQHDHPHQLNQKLQNEINHSQHYDIILLLYGLCGNAINNLTSKNVDMYVFKAHDCSTILLANQKKHLNQQWSCFALVNSKKSSGALTYEFLKLKYEENAQYLWEILRFDKELVYINFNKVEDTEAKKQLLEEGKKIIHEYKGSKDVVYAILNMKKHDLILKIYKDKKIKSVYDLDKVITSN